MPRGIYIRTEKGKSNLSKAHLLNPNRYWLGKKRPPFSKETIEKKRKEMIARYSNGFSPVKGKHWKLSDETKRKQSLAHAGVKQSEEHRKKNGDAHRGIKQSAESNLKRSFALKGRKKSEETKAKFKLLVKRGEDSHFWRGGVSHNPYSIDWTRTLKRSIRERDKYTCQLCGKEPAICVHHIDYNKLNCNPDNLITLCGNCHPKTNFDRDKWLEYFTLIKK